MVHDVHTHARVRPAASGAVPVEGDLSADGAADARPPAEGFVDLAGRRFYRIDHYDALDPFFMTVVGAGDPWLFVSSTGGLTAGRIGPDTALFPYYTDDKVAEGAGRTGGLSLLRVRSGDAVVLWEPFTAPVLPTDRVHRALYKDTLGSALVFEETQLDLGLRMRVTWETCDALGIVRSATLANLGADPVEADLLDGFVNLLPAGVDRSRNPAIATGSGIRAPVGASASATRPPYRMESQ